MHKVTEVATGPALLVLGPQILHQTLVMCISWLMGCPKKVTLCHLTKMSCQRNTSVPELFVSYMGHSYEPDPDALSKEYAWTPPSPIRKWPFIVVAPAPGKASAHHPSSKQVSHI